MSSHTMKKTEPATETKTPRVSLSDIQWVLVENGYSTEESVEIAEKAYRYLETVWEKERQAI